MAVRFVGALPSARCAQYQFGGKDGLRSVPFSGIEIRSKTGQNRLGKKQLSSEGASPQGHWLIKILSIPLSLVLSLWAFPFEHARPQAKASLSQLPENVKVLAATSQTQSSFDAYYTDALVKALYRQPGLLESVQDQLESSGYDIGVFQRQFPTSSNKTLGGFDSCNRSKVRYALLMGERSFAPATKTAVQGFVDRFSRSDEAQYRSAALRKMHRALQEVYGMPADHIKLLPTVTRYQFEQEVDRLARSLPKGAEVLIYYTGHHAATAKQSVSPAFQGEGSAKGFFGFDMTEQQLDQNLARLKAASAVYFIADTCQAGALTNAEENYTESADRPSGSSRASRLRV